METSLSRASITSDAYHRKNPEAAKYLFGLGDTWDECKEYMLAIFDVAPPQGDPLTSATKSVTATQDPLTVFEELIMTKMRMRKAFELKFLSFIWGKSRTLLGRIMKYRSVDWGEAGLDLSELDITNDYLQLDRPKEYLTGVRF